MIVEPRARGKIQAAEIEPGDAATVTAGLDFYEMAAGDKRDLFPQIVITFFCPNYKPRELKIGDRVWVEFYCFANWEDLTEAHSTGSSIESLAGRNVNFEYALQGEIFNVQVQGRPRDIYMKVPFPIMLTLGLPADLSRQTSVQDGKRMRLSRGRLFGNIEVT